VRHEAPAPCLVLEAAPTGFRTRVGCATIIAVGGIGGAFASCASAHDIGARTAGSETCFFRCRGAIRDAVAARQRGLRPPACKANPAVQSRGSDAAAIVRGAAARAATGATRGEHSTGRFACSSGLAPLPANAPTAARPRGAGGSRSASQTRSVWKGRLPSRRSGRIPNSSVGLAIGGPKPPLRVTG
jgi:hypothetical protein